jgi:hypothetical protein
VEWFNIHTSTLDSEEFLCSEPVDQATWLKLQRYCIGQENGGVICGAKGWTDRQWQHLVRATLKEVLRESRLWEWIGDDLKVKFYPRAKQLEVQAKRRAAESTHAKRHAKQDDERSAEHVAEQSGKGMEGKEREGEGNPPHSNRPSLKEAIEYFAKIRPDCTDGEVRDVWNSFEATIQDGMWFFGRRPVGNWTIAMETRLSDNRKKTAPGRPPGWQEGDDDLWWTGELALLEAAAAGAWIAQDRKKAARLDAIIAQRKGGR